MEIITDFPERLREIPGCPDKLYIRGNAALLPLLSVAIVGTRHPSHYGLAAAMRFGRELAAAGFCVVSGLARGIDAAAHRAALTAGGYTVAVLGHGLDRIYPSENAQLAADIVAKGGCLVSEFPPGTPPLPHHFPARNRLISGLSWGTLVVEAAVKSGSLITARYAVEQNREVFVLPGRFDDESFRGGHLLIQQGAKLVLTPNDLLDELPPLPGAIPPAPAPDAELGELFGRDETPQPLEALCTRFDGSLGELYARLEIAREAGWVVETHPRHYVWLPEKESFHPAPCQN